MRASREPHNSIIPSSESVECSIPLVGVEITVAQDIPLLGTFLSAHRNAHVVVLDVGGSFARAVDVQFYSIPTLSIGDQNELYPEVLKMPMRSLSRGLLHIEFR